MSQAGENAAAGDPCARCLNGAGSRFVAEIADLNQVFLNDFFSYRGVRRIEDSYIASKMHKSLKNALILSLLRLLVAIHL